MKAIAAMMRNIEIGQKVIRWRVDCDQGEMIERRANGEQYCRTHLSLPAVSQAVLDDVCNTVNKFFELSGSPLRVDASTGEFRPVGAEPALTYGSDA